MRGRDPDLAGVAPALAAAGATPPQGRTPPRRGPSRSLPPQPPRASRRRRVHRPRLAGGTLASSLPPPRKCPPASRSTVCSPRFLFSLAADGREVQPGVQLRAPGAAHNLFILRVAFPGSVICCEFVCFCIWIMTHCVCARGRLP